MQNSQTSNLGKGRLLFKLMRPRQWSKNLIIYAPVLFARHAQNPELLLMVSCCALSFCLISSSAYIINDVFDKETDKQHPLKCKRPIASGAITVQEGLILAVFLGIFGLSLSWWISLLLFFVTGAYLVLMILYSARLKHYPVLDIFSIAFGFVLRAVAGAVAARVPASGWFLLCTILGALFLACEKRRYELKLLQEQAELHRAALTLYSEDLLNRMEALILPSLLTCYVFYSFLSEHGQWMMLTVPFVLYGLLHYQLLSATSHLTGSPEEILFKDRPTQITILSWLVCSWAVVYGFAQKLILTFLSKYM